uniref:PAP-associated domain-containing protein n=1 Tax=Chromera velia CCMP2878 TaxID=1169474 RepID=A0A0K6S814_9ALVE|eukprot:Cvel_758.t2-p1 / transcript=Cvel_758.t2 / gene=Cvel_758 / organism=Chromera_velia_CCMP2878 / gene_product=hypothetical protein / transcript_product=hypothetical protein / location=Cvel_scaffold23:135473-136987(-) / protein_length=505 / sequence_SO=supercontig / SO=protein_coding / is_pseudo=false
MSLFSFDRFVQEADFAERSRLLSELDGIVNRRRPVVERVAQCFSALVSRHGVETQQHGSWTQDLALPDSDVDISCPEDPYLAGTRRALESPLNTSFLVEESVSEWRLLVRHWQTGVQLDVTQKAAHRTEPHWKAEHIRRSISWACDGNVRSAVLILKLWVRKHAEKFQPKNGYPNSYTFLLIFLFLCTHRERPVIPILSCKQDSSGSGGLSILRLARPSSLRLHSEDPLVLVQEFLGFLVSNLRGMQVDFDNDRKRKIPTSLEGSAEQAAKVWSVKEPFTGIIKCQTRGWVERVRPDIVARAQKDFFVISFASTGHVRRNAAEAFPSDLHRSGPTAPLGPGSHLSFPLTHFAAESPPPQQHRSEGSGFESLEAKFPPPFLTQHHPERHEPGSLFPSTPDWQREWHGLSQLYVQPHLQYQAQQHRYGQYHPYAPFHQMQVVYPFEGRADGFAVPPDYPAVQDLIPLSFDLSQQAWSGIVGSLGGRGKNGDLFTLGVGSQVPTGEGW